MSKASLLQEWLLRSQQLPISVHLNLAKPKKPKHTDIMWKIMDLVAHYSERWQHAHFDIPYLFDDEYCLVPHAFPQLCSLAMSNLVDFPRTLDMFQHAPILSEVSLEYSVTLIPTNILSRITVEYLVVSDCLMILRCCPNLQHCVFNSISHLDHTLLPAVASSLESLEIRFEAQDTRAMSQLLDNISVPSLRELTITMEGISFPDSKFIFMIQRSSCQLERLNLSNGNIEEAQLVKCLTILPSLKEVELREMTFGTYTIHKLTLDHNEDPSSSNALLPNLIGLSLSISGEIPFDLADLAKMLRSRRRWETAGDTESDLENRPKSVARMESIAVLAVACESFPSPAVLAQFQALEDDGMEVQLEISY